MPIPLAPILATVGVAWGLVADRIAARWPAHEDGSVRPVDWRTPVTALIGGAALGAVPGRFEGDAVAIAIYAAYVAALTLLLATDLDQRLLPDVITLPAIPLAFLVTLLGLNPLTRPGDLPIAILVALVVPLGLALLARPFGAGAIGMGDLKLLVSVGLLAGGLRMFTGVVYGALLAGVVIVVLLVARRISLKTYIPFGPFLILGALWAMLAIR